MVYWRQVGALSLEKQRLSVYSREPGNTSEESRSSALFRWHTWQGGTLATASWPNLPIFVALVNVILDQRNVNTEESTSLATVQESAALAKRRNRRKKRLLIVFSSISILIVLSLALGIPIYQSVQQDQRAAHDAQLLREYFTKRAHQPYAVHVPGEHCGNGKEFWLDDDSKNMYTCQKDGLLMTQKNFQYQDGEWFTFIPDTLSTMDAFSSVNYFPHHYRVQVKATILSGGPDTCVSVTVHIQDFQGNQSFDLCADGSWTYYRCDLHCNTETPITSGNLPHTSSSSLITVEVTDSLLSFSIDHTKVTSVHDHTYTSTNQLELDLYGNQHASEPVTALFSDFSYTPLS